jgi:DNA phosphorothioation-associated putative methyltransferase
VASIGKRIGNDLYVHHEFLSELEAHGLAWAVSAVSHLRASGAHGNVVRVGVQAGDVSLLSYPDFEDAPFPSLVHSYRIDAKGAIRSRSYASSLNPPVLHRKELLVGSGHPSRKRWEEITTHAESLGLFDDSSAIGFRLNWLRLVASKGYEVCPEGLRPIGNLVDQEDAPVSEPSAQVQRHLTALSRTSLSAPVQTLIRHELLTPERSFFDYGCGKGSDMDALRAAGFSVAGWDPHYRETAPLYEAEVVNLGFVVNVIEDPAERVEAVQQAFKLTKGVLAVAVMLRSASDGGGVPYSDGILTSRNTFQKYFTQDEIRSYLEDVLSRPVHMVGPGIAFVFGDDAWQQRFESSRYRGRDVAQRLLSSVFVARPVREPRQRRVREPTARVDRASKRLEEVRPLLDRLWAMCLDLGRWPEGPELEELPLQGSALSWGRAKRLLETYYDADLLQRAAQMRRDDLLVFFAAQLFERRAPFKQLEPRLRRDVKSFFGDYALARQAAQRSLQDSATPAQMQAACLAAAEMGLGWLDGDHSLQVHSMLIPRLPAVLRIYIDCGFRLWKAGEDFQIVKVHIQSGKVTFLAYEDFDGSPTPLLRKRVKVNLRRLVVDVFEYGTKDYPKPLLLWKSRYVNEEWERYPDQLAFERDLERSEAVASTESDLFPSELEQRLNLRRLEVQGYRLVPSERIPALDEPCGRNFTFRSFIECGQTQARTGCPNVPRSAQTYNALHALAVQILDPVIEYFGGIRLTYGFCSAELARAIPGRIAPELDQHASHEVNRRGNLICARGGAACDFVVEDEDMLEVADWIIANLAFDRLYVYGADRPIHVSWGPEMAHAAFRLTPRPSGRAVPQVYRPDPTRGTSGQ